MKKYLKSKKIISALILALFMFGIFSALPIYAEEGPNGNYGLNEAVKDPATKKDMLKAEDPAAKVGQIIGYLLSFVGLLFLLLVIYGGYTWMTAGGNDQEVAKAKSLLTQAVFGLIIISAAYLLVKFVGDIILGQFTT